MQNILVNKIMCGQKNYGPKVKYIQGKARQENTPWQGKAWYGMVWYGSTL